MKRSSRSSSLVMLMSMVPAFTPSLLTNMFAWSLEASMADMIAEFELLIEVKINMWYANNDGEILL